MICWVYLHFRFRLLRLVSPLSLSPSSLSTPLSPRLGHIPPLFVHVWDFSLVASLASISGFWSTLPCQERRRRYGRRRREMRKRGRRGEFGRLRNDISHILSPLTASEETCLCTFKEWLGDGVATGGVSPSLFLSPDSPWPLHPAFIVIILPSICPAASRRLELLRWWPKMTTRFCLLNSVYVARTSERERIKPWRIYFIFK